jgi:polysaccharide chain length determinant protein (PEP-CTERM system associated)
MIGHRQLTFDDYLAIFRRRKWTLLICVVVCTIAGYFVSLVVPKQYTSQTVILVQQPAVPESYVTDISSGDLKQRLTALQEQILSRSKLEAIINKLGLYSDERGTASMETLVARLQKKIKVTPVKPMPESNSTQLPGFVLMVSDRDRGRAQKICNEVSSLFLSENLRIKQEQAQGTTLFLTKTVEDAKKKLDDQDAKLAAFKSRYLGALPDDQQANLSILSGLNNQLQAANEALSRAQEDKTFAESMLAQQAASQSGGSTSLEKQLADMQSQLSVLQTKYTEEHPDVIRLKQNISDLKQKIAANEKNGVPANKADAAVVDTPEVQQLRAQVHQYDAIVKEKTAEQRDLQRQISMYQGRVQLSPNVEEQYKQLTRDYQAAMDSYNDLLKKRSDSAMESDINTQQQSAEFRVLDPPNLPDSPSFPNRLYFTLGGLGAGLALGLGAVVLGEARDKTLRTEDDVEFFLQLPTLANIPSVANARRSATAGGKEGPRLVANA